jgi:hypothetical protein
MAAFCRQQLFGYLEHSAAVMVAFHYAHTDAAQSMLHFDLLLQEDLQPQERDRGVQAAAGLHAVDTAEAAKAKIIQKVSHFRNDCICNTKQELQPMSNTVLTVLLSAALAA